MRRAVTVGVRVLTALALGVTGLVAVETLSPAPAEAACAAPTKTLGGTFQGEDGRYVSGLIGFELFDAFGNKLEMNGCRKTSGGYTHHVGVNTYGGGCCYILPGEGSPTTPYQGWNLTKNWSVSGIPSNAATAWIEAYTGKAGGQPNTSTIRYGWSLRRPISLSNTNVVIRQPLNCGLSENGVTGTTGEISGWVYVDGRRVTPTKVSAFSTSPDGGNRGPIRSFNVEDDSPDGGYRVGSLSPGTYSVFITYGYLKKRFDNLQVGACSDTVTDVALSGPVPPRPPPDKPPWAAEAIDWLLTNGYATGYPDGTFRGYDPIGRAQNAGILHRLQSTPPPSGECGGLSDIPPWAHDPICWLVEEGYATGYPDGTFRPYRNINRAQAARMIHELNGSPPPGAGCGGMTDVPVWAADAICWMINNGHMSGYWNATFQPYWDINRAQIANVLYNIYG